MSRKGSNGIPLLPVLISCIGLLFTDLFEVERRLPVFLRQTLNCPRPFQRNRRE